MISLALALGGCGEGGWTGILGSGFGSPNDRAIDADISATHDSGPTTRNQGQQMWRLTDPHPVGH